MKTIRLLIALVCALAAVEAFAVEGKWMPQQILEIDPQELRKLGLDIAPDKLWSRDGAGLLAAAVKVGTGCSGGFISAEGLVITNHHCVFDILQQHSTPERNLIENGFLARTRAEELSGKGTRITIPHRITDVTDEVEAAVPAGADDLARFQAIERKRKEMVAACEQQPNRRCQVEAFDGGDRYRLIEGIEYPDARLVFAPPRSVGEYGGEVDNWSWPRHTGDFALLRIWAGADGGPIPEGKGTGAFRPPHFFPVSAKGVAPGTFVMALGYPGVTYRSLAASEMRERAEHYFPRRAALYRSWMDLMEASSAQSEEARIALADRLKTLGNREKNARGQVEGLRRGRILEKKEAAEKEVLAWAAGRPEQAPAVAARQELEQTMEGVLRTWDRDFLLDQTKSGPKPLELALTLVRWSGEKVKPDLEREGDYMERERERLRERLQRDQRRMHLPTEEALLADLFQRYAALPEGSRVAAIDSLLGDTRTPDAVRDQSAKTASDLIARTKVTDAAERDRMFDESTAELQARRDPLLDLAFSLDRELKERKEREDRHKGTVSRLRPRWHRAVVAHAGRPVAPDGNGTLRVSLAHVQGYAPRDAMRYEPQTTVGGIVEKNTGEDPFDAPEAVLAAAPSASKSRWADPKLQNVAVGFLADADTTSGSSGSPILNGRGELVGVNFDRVWENVASDFGYNPAVARNVSVDVRYLFWIMETLHGDGAQGVLKEMGVR